MPVHMDHQLKPLVAIRFPFDTERKRIWAAYQKWKDQKGYYWGSTFSHFVREAIDEKVKNIEDVKSKKKKGR